MSPSPERPDRPAESGAAPRTPPLGSAPSPPDATDSLDAATSAPSAAVRGAVRRIRGEHERRAGTMRSQELSAWLALPTEAAALGALPPAAAGAVPFDAADPLVGLLAQLRAVTTPYVYRMRADGTPPEKMLVRVKACVREAMSAEGWQDPEAAQLLTSTVVGWSIAAYYDR